MNALTRGSLYTLGISAVCVGLGLLDAATGIVGRVAPTEAHAFAWLAIIVVCAMIARSYARSGARLPDIGRMATPRTKTRYAKRTRRYV